MSLNSVSGFLARVAEDKALKDSLVQGGVTEKQIVSIAAEYGYEFTIDELSTKVTALSESEWEATNRYNPSQHVERFFFFLEEREMSKDALNAFFKKVSEDSALQSKLIEFAAQQGFEFTSDELSDTDLDSVAGGLTAAPKLESKMEPKSIGEIKFIGGDEKFINDPDRRG